MEHPTLLLLVKLAVIISFAILAGFTIAKMVNTAPRKVAVVLMAVVAIITTLPALLQALDI